MRSFTAGRAAAVTTATVTSTAAGTAAAAAAGKSYANICIITRVMYEVDLPVDPLPHAAHLLMNEL